VLKISPVGAGLAAIIYGALFTFKNIRQGVPDSMQVGRVVSLKTTLIFAGTIALVQLASAALDAKFGRAGVIAAAATAGFALRIPSLYRWRLRRACFQSLPG
jgi:uncharacterized membrane protein (DUF4010 family)